MAKSLFVSIVQSVSVRNIVSLQKSLPSSDSYIPIVCAKIVCENMLLNEVFSIGEMLFVTRKIKKAVDSCRGIISLLFCCYPTVDRDFFECCVLAGTRTLDPLIKSQLLYQLSYEDNIHKKWSAKVLLFSQ